MDWMQEAAHIWRSGAYEVYMIDLDTHALFGADHSGRYLGSFKTLDEAKQRAESHATKPRSP